MTKKTIAWLLIFLLTLPLASCNAGGESYTYLTPSLSGSNWRFDITVHNTTETDLYLTELKIHYFKGDTRVGTMHFSGIGLDRLDLSTSESIVPGGSITWFDELPMTDVVDRVEYRFLLQPGKGKQQEQVFRYVLKTDGKALVQESGQASQDAAPTLNSDAISPITEGADWIFEMFIHNDTDSILHLEQMEILRFLNGEPTNEPFCFNGQDLYQIVGFESLHPQETQRWTDGHPIVPDFDQAEYHFLFTDSTGAEVRQVYRYDMSGADSVIPAETPQLTPSQPQSAPEREGYILPIYNGDSWRFEMTIFNDTDSVLTPHHLECVHKQNGVLFGDVFIHDRAAMESWGICAIAPGESTAFIDNHPIVPDFNECEYHYVFLDESGKEVVKSFLYQLDMQPTDLNYSADDGKDLLTLRHEADFEAEVAPDVYWVPAAALGESNFGNDEIYAMLKESPQAKQEAIHTLYEALQLYQVGNFMAADDNQRIHENGINWEHHKPGYHAVRTNSGCCATDSNWLNYILRGDYEQVGYIATSQRDGNGHIYNYLVHDGWYYFIDLTHYRNDWVATAVESGNLNDYYATDFVLGNIHKSKSVQAYVDYVQNTFGDPPGLMFQYAAEDCLAVDSVQHESSITITYEARPGVDVKVIFDDPNDELDSVFVDPPQRLPAWELEPDFVFPQ